MKSRQSIRQEEIGKAIKNLNQRMHEAMNLFGTDKIDLQNIKENTPLGYFSSKVSNLLEKVNEGFGSTALQYNEKTGLLKNSKQNRRILDLNYEEKRRNNEKNAEKMHEQLINEIDNIRLGRIYADFLQEFSGVITPPKNIKGKKELEKYFNSLKKEDKEKLFKKAFEEVQGFKNLKKILDKLYSYDSTTTATTLGFGKGGNKVNYSDLADAIWKYEDEIGIPFDADDNNQLGHFLKWLKYNFKAVRGDESVADKVKAAEDDGVIISINDYE